MYVLVYSYFMLKQAIVQNTFPEVPTWQAIARGEAENITIGCYVRTYVWSLYTHV